MKNCNVCGQKKHLIDYFKNPLAKDGRQNRCKKCVSEIYRNKGILSRKKNIELVLLENEIFKPIIINNNYLISNYGRVYVKEHFSTKYVNSKFLKLTKLKSGYPTVSIDKVKYLVHRLVAIQFIENKDVSKNIVNHKDSVRDNNKVLNLEWVTISENIKHGSNKDNYSNKLNRIDVINILKDKYSTTKELSIRFNVSTTNINLIKNRKIWKHITI